MIKKLRIKITVILSAVLAVVIIGIMVSINVVSRANNQTQISERLLKIAYNNGKIPPEYRDTNLYHGSNEGYIDTFSVLVDGAYRLIGIYLGRNDDTYVQDECIEYANEAINSHQERGEIGSYAYLIELKSYGKIIVFLDISQYHRTDNQNSHALSSPLSSPELTRSLCGQFPNLSGPRICGTRESSRNCRSACHSPRQGAEFPLL